MLKLYIASILIITIHLLIKAKKASKIPIEILGKTGTSQKNRDAWFIGCAKNHVVGVWIGRDDDKSMKNLKIEQF